MGLLDNQNHRAKIDRENMLSSLESFPDQVEQAIVDGNQFTIPSPFINIKKIVMAGMGGSGISSKIVEKFCFSRSKIPVQAINEYSPPASIDNQTLLIAISCSGETEETITAFVKAAERGTKLCAISRNGVLEALSRKYKNPFFKIEEEGAPRTLLPYILTLILVILSRLNVINEQRENLKESVLMSRSLKNKIGWSIPTSQNPAKQLAEKIDGKIPIVYASGLSAAIAERWKQQFNENGKQASFFEVIPEVCHNGVEGWQFPKRINQNAFVILLQSKYDSSSNKLRHSAILQLLQKQGMPHETVLLHPSSDIVSEIFQIVLFGDYVSYYLALLNGIDPSLTEKIDFIKEKIAEG